MTLIDIQPIGEKDKPFLWDMLYEMVHIPNDKPPKELLLAMPGIRQCLEGWGKTGDEGVIAETAQGASIGAAWYRLSDESRLGYGFVDEQTPELSIAVLPEHANRGIGTQLLQALIEKARTRGYPGLSLSVDPANRAMRLCERFGFKRCGVSGTSVTMLLRF